MSRSSDEEESVSYVPHRTRQRSVGSWKSKKNEKGLFQKIVFWQMDNNISRVTLPQVNDKRWHALSVILQVTLLLHWTHVSIGKAPLVRTHVSIGRFSEAGLLE